MSAPDTHAFRFTKSRFPLIVVVRTPLFEDAFLWTQDRFGLDAELCIGVTCHYNNPAGKWVVIFKDRQWFFLFDRGLEEQLVEFKLRFG